MHSLHCILVFLTSISIPTVSIESEFTSYPDIVTNEMLDGEVIRLDGAIRLAPKQSIERPGRAMEKARRHCCSAGRGLKLALDQNLKLALAYQVRPRGSAYRPS